MRNFRDMVEAAYAFSRRQGDMRRDRGRERSTHEDRRNRYLTDEMQPGASRYAGATGPRQTMDAHQPAGYAREEILRGNHKGKGPRNYRRSDMRLTELVCERMYDDPNLDASEIEVTVKDSEVILTGTVYDRQSKRLAEDLAESVSGVVNVENRLKVQERIMA